MNLRWLWPVALAMGAAYATALRGEMIVDDAVAISNNPTIHNLRHLAQVLNPPNDGSPEQGRPDMAERQIRS